MIHDCLTYPYTLRCISDFITETLLSVLQAECKTLIGHMIYSNCKTTAQLCNKHLFGE